mmetsp:Transcript_8055/g.10546  ORF Transcript_8055/g.10546 Transcript_8055/m.10546 type:complete len:264 (-) Transcript_8055:751-1542(-)
MYDATTPEPTDNFAERRSVMFSPIVPIAAFTVSSTDLPDGCAVARTASTVPSVERAASAIPFTRLWNSSFFATKSVSELSSITTAELPSLAIPTRPSAAVRPDFLSAFAIPFARNQSTAASMSPPASVSAFLQSIIPAPDFSRSSLTIAAVMLIIASFCQNIEMSRNVSTHHIDTYRTVSNLSTCVLSQIYDIGGCLDRAPPKSLSIKCALRSSWCFFSCWLFCKSCFSWCFNLCTQINARSALLTCNTIDTCTRNKITIKRN